MTEPIRFRSPFECLEPPSRTLVVDPPWHYGAVNPPNPDSGYGIGHGDQSLGYSTMTLEEIRALPVGALAHPEGARCFLWITNRYLRHGWGILEGWGFEPSERVFVWTKKPRGTTPVTTEYLLFGSVGSPARMPWLGTTWFAWPHRGRRHSEKPAAALDLIETLSPEPYVELFARSPRLGWDSWGLGYEGHA